MRGNVRIILITLSILCVVRDKLSALPSEQRGPDDLVAAVTGAFQSLEQKLSEIASSPRIASMGLDSVNALFGSLLKRNQAVTKLMRINSAGIVINESSKAGNEKSMRDISGQRWFVQVKSTKRPYYGTSRDSLGSTSFFWVWPMQNSARQFAGTITAQIHPSRIVSSVNGTALLPLKIVCNGKIVHKHLWNDNVPAAQKKWSISDALELSFWYPAAGEQERSAGSEIFVDTLMEAQSAEKEMLSSAHVSAESEKPASKSSFILLFFTLLGGSFLVIGLLVRKRILRRANSFTFIQDVNRSESALETLSDMQPDCIVNLEDETEQFSSSCLAEADACIEEEIPVPDSLEPPQVQEDAKALSTEQVDEAMEETFGAEECVTLAESSDTPGIGLRRELYREIHGQLMHWVICESARLSSRLDELTDRINRIEQGDDPELDSIKEETIRISREIELFRTHLSDNT